MTTSPLMPTTPEPSILLSSPAANLLPMDWKAAVVVSKQAQPLPAQPMQSQPQQQPQQQHHAAWLPGAREYRYRPKHMRPQFPVLPLSGPPLGYQPSNLSGPLPGYEFPARFPSNSQHPFTAASHSARKQSKTVKSVTKALVDHSMVGQGDGGYAYPTYATFGQSIYNAPAQFIQTPANLQRLPSIVVQPRPSQQGYAQTEIDNLEVTRQLMLDNLRMMNDLTGRALLQMEALEKQAQPIRRASAPAIVPNRFQIPINNFSTNENSFTPIEKQHYPEPAFTNQSYRLLYAAEAPPSPEKVRTAHWSSYRANSIRRASDEGIARVVANASRREEIIPPKEALAAAPDYNPILATIIEDVEEQNKEISALPLSGKQGESSEVVDLDLAPGDAKSEQVEPERASKQPEWTPAGNRRNKKRKSTNTVRFEVAADTEKEAVAGNDNKAEKTRGKALISKSGNVTTTANGPVEAKKTQNKKNIQKKKIDQSPCEV